MSKILDERNNPLSLSILFKVLISINHTFSCYEPPISTSSCLLGIDDEGNFFSVFAVECIKLINMCCVGVGSLLFKRINK